MLQMNTMALQKYFTYEAFLSSNQKGIIEINTISEHMSCTMIFIYSFELFKIDYQHVKPIQDASVKFSHNLC